LWNGRTITRGSRTKWYWICRDTPIGPELNRLVEGKNVLAAIAGQKISGRDNLRALQHFI